MPDVSKPSGHSESAQRYTEEAQEEERQRLNNEVSKSLHAWYKHQGVDCGSMRDVVEKALVEYKERVERGESDLPS